MPHLPDAPNDGLMLSEAIKHASQQLGLNEHDLASILGICERFAKDFLSDAEALPLNQHALARAAHLQHFYNSLLLLVGGDIALARGWIHSTNLAFGEQKPIDVMKQPNGITRICTYLDASLFRG